MDNGRSLPGLRCGFSTPPVRTARKIGTDVGFGLQKEKIIKVGPIKRNELMFMNARDLV